MSSPSAKSNLLWALVPLIVAGLLYWFNASAAERVSAVSALFSDRLVDPALIAGAEVNIEVRRSQIVPGHNLESMELMLQAEQLREQETWRLTKVEYDNAPNGRGVETPSAPRWWLALMSSRENEAENVSKQVADAALKSDPLLHVILLVLFYGLVAWQWGLFPAAMGTLVIGLYYPLVGSFHPGAPAAAGLATAAVGLLWIGFVFGLKNVLERKAGQAWWIVSAIAGATTIWVSPNRGFLLVAALFLAGLLVIWRQRNEADTRPLPWWSWGVAGAGAILAFWGIDYAPREAAWANGRLHQIHPLYALSWLGLAGVGATLSRGLNKKSDWAKVTLGALAGLAIVGYMIVTKDEGMLAVGLGADLIVHLPDVVSSSTFAEWVNANSSGAAAAGTILPLGLMVWAVWLGLQKSTTSASRTLLLAMLLPLIVSVALGFSNLSWWGTVGVGLAILAGTLATEFAILRSRLVLLGLLLLGVGIAWGHLIPLAREAASPEPTASDVRSLAERDLAHWLSLRGDEFRSVVLSPPDVTPALYYYGGVRGLGSPYAENGDGFIAAVRIASASSPDESLALATQRELAHIVIPSWDGFLDEYARLGAAQPEHSMMAMLHNWLAPRWMRAVDHSLPDDDLFDDMSTTIFSVTETQDNASALSRLGEYFAETKQPQFATAIAVTLQKSFPSDLSGLVAQAHIAVSQGNLTVFNEALQSIRQNVEDERDGDLEFDRRVSLANILMLGREAELARDQVLYCMDEVDAYLLKTVSTANLYRFVLLADSLQEPFPEPELGAFARALLPAEMADDI
ncbi:MAG: hypothetical protein SynsKO_08520 [Synoicihabitans sp.]